MSSTVHMHCFFSPSCNSKSWELLPSSFHPWCFSRSNYLRLYRKEAEGPGSKPGPLFLNNLEYYLLSRFHTHTLILKLSNFLHTLYVIESWVLHFYYFFKLLRHVQLQNSPQPHSVYRRGWPTLKNSWQYRYPQTASKARTVFIPIMCGQPAQGSPDPLHPSEPSLFSAPSCLFYCTSHTEMSTPRPH